MLSTLRTLCLSIMIVAACTVFANPGHAQPNYGEAFTFYRSVDLGWHFANVAFNFKGSGNVAAIFYYLGAAEQFLEEAKRMQLAAIRFAQQNPANGFTPVVNSRMLLLPHLAAKVAACK